MTQSPVYLELARWPARNLSESASSCRWCSDADVPDRGLVVPVVYLLELPVQSAVPTATAREVIRARGREGLP